jgi:hypothetical protein
MTARRLTACLVAAGLTASACAAAPSGGPAVTGKPISRMPVKPVPITRASVTPGGVAWVAHRGGIVSIAAGGSWRSLHPPEPPAPGNSIAASGPTVLVASLSGLSLHLARSTDAGRTWQRQSARLDEPADAAGVAMSTDMKQVAVAVSVPGAAGGAGGYSPLFVGPSGGPLARVNAPGGPDIAWASFGIVAPGGPLRSRLYVSTDRGTTWRPEPVGGPVAPDRNVSPDVPAIGVPVSLGGGVVVPLTRPGAVALYRTTDGSHFALIGTVRVSGDTGPGVGAVVSPYGPDGLIVADPASTVLHTVIRGASGTRPGRGLPGPVDVLSFQDESAGLAQITVRACASGKVNCIDEPRLYQTADGGATWTRTTP